MDYRTNTACRWRHVVFKSVAMQRLWNLINLPVYSLATYQDETVNMNICTYVSAVSMKPKRYIIAVDPLSQTFQNLIKHPHAVLQLLGKNHGWLINTLGKKSGKNYAKENYLEKKKLLMEWQSKKVLTNCAGWVNLNVLSYHHVGDHMVFVMDVQQHKTNHIHVLMLDDLRKKKLIRI